MRIKFIENRSEIGAGSRGSSLGIDALRIASLNAHNSFFKDNKVLTIKDQNHLLYEPIKYTTAKRIEGISEVFHEISSTVETTLETKEFPFVLAADHSSAGGTIAGIKKHYPNKRLGVIWIDAHADLHSPYTSPSGNVHGMPLATAINSDNLECKIKEVEKEAVTEWEKLKNCGGIAPKILPKDILFYGVRDTEIPEERLIEKEGIKNFTVAEVRKKGIAEVASEGLKLLNDCDIIYISFDVDSMDCDVVSVGTGTPVPNGFLPEEADGLIQHLIKSEKLVCFEMVEVNPTLDNKQNKMADVSFEILDNAVKTLKSNLP